MSRILFWIFSLQKCTRLSYEQLWKRKRTRNNRSRKLFTIVSQTRLFTDFINSSPPSANVARRLFYWTRKNTKKKVSSNPRYFLSNALFQTQKSMTTRSILDSSHDFVLVSRLNFQHIHYSVFPAVVSSSFHLFQIHRLIKTRSNKNSRTFMVLL